MAPTSDSRAALQLRIFGSAGGALTTEPRRRYRLEGQRRSRPRSLMSRPLHACQHTRIGTSTSDLATGRPICQVVPQLGYLPAAARNSRFSAAHLPKESADRPQQFLPRSLVFDWVARRGIVRTCRDEHASRWLRWRRSRPRNHVPLVVSRVALRAPTSTTEWALLPQGARRAEMSARSRRLFTVTKSSRNAWAVDADGEVDSLDGDFSQ
jgi:hypothetical protein